MFDIATAWQAASAHLGPDLALQPLQLRFPGRHRRSGRLGGRRPLGDRCRRLRGSGFTARHQSVPLVKRGVGVRHAGVFCRL